MAKKDNVIRRVEDIDEKELLEALAGYSEGSVRKNPPQKDVVTETENIPKIPTGKTTVRSAPGNYKTAFLNPRGLKTRQCVYISTELHEKILAIVNEIAEKGMTVSAFIDTVLFLHLEEHKQEINNLYRRKRDDLI